MKQLLISTLSALTVALSFNAAAAPVSSVSISNDKNELRQGRVQSSKGESRSVSKHAQPKQHSHSGYRDRGWYDPAEEMRSALRHIWKEHRFDDYRGRRGQHRHGKQQRHGHSSKHKHGGHESRSYAWERYDDPHYVRYYDNDFYVYLNDPYYREHLRGAWWGHYHRGEYCRTKHRYLLHDDIRNLMMLGLIIDFER